MILRRGLWALSLAGMICCSRQPVIHVAEVGSTNTWTLTSRHGTFAKGISLSLKGRLEGSADLIVSDWATQALTGQVDWKITHDLTTSNCVVVYAPQNVRGGQLEITYFFH